MNTFNFQEALSFMQSGLNVELTLDNKRRVYSMHNGAIFCTPNNKEQCTYVVKKFQIDAILSNDWQLVNDSRCD